MGLRWEACGDDGVGCDAASIMLKAVALPHMLPGSVLLACAGKKTGPDCAPEAMMEEVRRIMKRDITVMLWV